MNEATNLLEFIATDRLLYALLIALGAWVVIGFFSRTLHGLGERFTSRRLALKRWTTVLRFAAILATFVVVASNVFRFSDEALLAVGGSVAVAVGFAFKDLVASTMAGIILLFDRPFQVGDRVEFDGHYGEVVETGLRAVRLVTLDDNLVSIPNNQFLTGAVACANSGALDQMCVLDFYIGCNEDLRTAKRLVHEAAVASRYVYLDKPVSVVVREGPVPDAPERFALRLTVKAYVFDSRYETAFGTDITERVRQAFRHHGVRSAGELEWNRRQAHLEAAVV